MAPDATCCQSCHLQRHLLARAPYVRPAWTCGCCSGVSARGVTRPPRLPRTLPRAELAARRQELEDEVAAIVCNNPRALEEFQERSRAIDDLRRETGAQAGDLAVLEGEIDAIRVGLHGGSAGGARGGEGQMPSEL